jgi:hypothetical protein
LRPEFVKRNPVPLSSDAFSRFGQHHKDVHEREVVEATQRLHRKVIPRFAAWLDSQDERRLKGLKLTQLMHREGINNRHVPYPTSPYLQALPPPPSFSFFIPPRRRHWACVSCVRVWCSWAASDFW